MLHFNVFSACHYVHVFNTYSCNQNSLHLIYGLNCFGRFVCVEYLIFSNICCEFHVIISTQKHIYWGRCRHGQYSFPSVCSNHRRLNSYDKYKYMSNCFVQPQLYLSKEKEKLIKVFLLVWWNIQTYQRCLSTTLVAVYTRPTLQGEHSHEYFKKNKQSEYLYNNSPLSLQYTKGTCTYI